MMMVAIVTYPRSPQNLDNSSVAADRLVGELKFYLQACVIIVLVGGYEGRFVLSNS